VRTLEVDTDSFQVVDHDGERPGQQERDVLAQVGEGRTGRRRVEARQGGVGGLTFVQGPTAPAAQIVASDLHTLAIEIPAARLQKRLGPAASCGPGAHLRATVFRVRYNTAVARVARGDLHTEASGLATPAWDSGDWKNRRRLCASAGSGSRAAVRSRSGAKLPPKNGGTPFS
jgi:hypothetical protein